jgi:hypothetical protein
MADISLEFKINVSLLIQLVPVKTLLLKHCNVKLISSGYNDLFNLYTPNAVGNNPIIDK